MPNEPTSGQLLVGVEEEFLLVDAESRQPTPRITKVLGNASHLVGDQAQEELHQAQIEHATTPCDSLGDLRREVQELRCQFVRAAAAEESVVVASGTYPGHMGESGRLITSDDRYEELARANSIVAREQLICGCHIHVSIANPERAIQVMNRIRIWMPYLLALSANSPYWEGEDTGFASYRTEVWTRWPTSGPPGHFESFHQYRQLVDRLVEAEVIVDEKMAYWDVRPSLSFPTIEVRVNDVMARVDDVIAIAGIVRCLVATCEAESGSMPPFRNELLRASNWRSARSGLSGTLLSAADGLARPAHQAIEELLEYISPALAQRGETDEIQRMTRAILERGNGAVQQRSAFERHHRMADVIDAVTLGADGHPGRLSSQPSEVMGDR